jgi:CelD/BcsL family acetyltransferase involved in cellulose biosynthesis
MQFLFWRSIQEAKREGFQVFDLGRSDSDQTGLITFKDRLGSMQTTLTYSRFSCSAHSRGNYTPAECDWQKRAAQRIVASLPNCLLPAIGRLVYRHVA